MSKLTPKYEELQSIYDISNEFYELFLGPTMGYTCGYFEREDMTGDEAQIAKFDLALGKLGLEPGMTLLDIGCGWGGGMARAIEKYDVNVIGLTLSGEQREYAIDKLSKVPTERNVEVRLQGWEEFNDKVDRIVSIGAFEHFGFERYPAFFEMAYNALPDDGTMLLHNITGFDLRQGQKLGLHMTFEDARFARFIMTEIFPGGRLPSVSMEEEKAKEAGFNVARVQEIGPHYVRTLKIWADALEAHKEEALALQGQVVYDRYDKYLNGCQKYFASGHISVHQFTLQK
ncbi:MULTISPECIES: cyclopropane mycolic acid synthase family methyltransferase [unclassified Mycolicibacterium]|uniref:cyclopropane mycolic acid synthase family methyltransferase n=1 Tax=unclassified Mycolicibacterium TaxID=2636767 RepID=UPI0012DED347|nr:MULTISPECIES: cyclopropane mycolic acid synthase family methyltransferase [unclassified Mycolicibacterium]MUL81515.1 methyltransferase domain-containing protein [Mycolicibacterium sp. CBMA 329]MUL87281.1 methyltransferase domain-containing protein [Mycolicibacterium sp. CBMA 331]MUM02568.1 methyltransferase domain-containing protein [Mycolicibacterium sp. CBMA 334]MUM25196.1 methyltransferase domain-containing protein [Mycolicibacterium sp. CBMA 295]MUM37578.1 methyltransferase domain-conta